MGVHRSELRPEPFLADAVVIPGVRTKRESIDGVTLVLQKLSED